MKIIQITLCDDIDAEVAKWQSRLDVRRTRLGGTNIKKDDAILNNYGYIYGYDEQMRMTMKQLPGCKSRLDAYDFTARWYTPAMPRFTTVDPCADSYHPISPYTFCAANPINLTDPTGRELRLNGSVTNIVSYISIYQRGIGDNAILYYENGCVKYKQKANYCSEPKSKEKSAYNHIKKIIDNEKSMMLELERGTEVIIGSVDGRIDMYDVEALGEDGPANDFDALLHETDEQYNIQIEGKTPTSAHVRALQQETNILGIQFPDDADTRCIDFKSGAIDYKYLKMGTTEKLHITIYFDPKTKNIKCKSPSFTQ